MSLSQQDDCLTRKDTNNHTAKHGNNTKTTHTMRTTTHGD